MVALENKVSDGINTVLQCIYSLSPVSLSLTPFISTALCGKNLGGPEKARL